MRTVFNVILGDPFIRNQPIKLSVDAEVSNVGQKNEYIAINAISGGGEILSCLRTGLLLDKAIREAASAEAKKQLDAIDEQVNNALKSKSE